MIAVTFKTISDLLADPVLGKLPEVREYRRVRGNDLDENPAFEQGRSYVRDFADAALLAIAQQPLAPPPVVAVEQAGLAAANAHMAEGFKRQRDAEKARAVGLYEEVAMYGRANGELKDALADEKARADRLQVCGTCDHNGGTRCYEPQARDDGFYWETGNDGRLQECAFTPSRWTMHEVLGRRTGGEK